MRPRCIAPRWTRWPGSSRSWLSSARLSGYGDPDVWHVNMQAMMDGDMAESLYITRNDDPDGEPVALMLAYIVPCPFSGETQVWEQAWFVTAGERGQPHAFTLLAALEEPSCGTWVPARLDGAPRQQVRRTTAAHPAALWLQAAPDLLQQGAQPWVLVQSQGRRRRRHAGSSAKAGVSRKP